MIEVMQDLDWHTSNKATPVLRQMLVGHLQHHSDKASAVGHPCSFNNTSDLAGLMDTQWHPEHWDCCKGSCSLSLQNAHVIAQ